jgi:salicylate hydroxylase
VVYPISGGKFINFVAAVHDLEKEGAAWEGPWNGEVMQRELLDQFPGWEGEYQALMKVGLRSRYIHSSQKFTQMNQCIKRPTRWALQCMGHLDTFAKGRVLLIGDAVCCSIRFCLILTFLTNGL